MSAEDRTQTIYAEQENCFVETQLSCCKNFSRRRSLLSAFFATKKTDFNLKKHTSVNQ